MESSFLTAVFNYLFGWTVLTVILSWLLAVVYPVFAGVLKDHHPKRVALFTLLYGLLAPAATIVSLVLLSHPTVSFPFVMDHCHDLNCTPHALHMTTDTIEGIITVVIAVSLLAIAFAMILFQILRTQNKLLVLSRLSEPTESAYRVVENPAHLAWCVGLFKPQVYLSSGLIDALLPEQLQVVLAHEWAHAVRKDNLRKWCLHWATIIWPIPLRNNIRQDFIFSSELVCDLIAVSSKSQESVRDSSKDSSKECSKDTLINNLIDTLNVCGASSKKDEALTPLSMDERKSAALSLKTWQSRKNRFTEFKPLGTIVCLWVIVVLLGVHFGHPLLEWLSN